MKILSAGTYFYPNNYTAFKSRDLLELSSDNVMKKVKASVNPENLIGEGSEAEVYKIKNTKYCVRIPHISSDMYCSDYNQKLSNADKINHVKVKLGFGSAILEFFKGVTPSKYKYNEAKRHSLQDKIAKMPIKSYKELLHQMANAIDNDLIFDCSGGNIIINTLKKKLTAIDFYGMSVDDPRPIRPLYDIHTILTYYGAKPETSKQIGEKVLLTGLEEFKPNVVPCMDLLLFDFEELLDKLRDKQLCKDNADLKEKLKELREIKKKEIINKNLSQILQKRYNWGLFGTFEL